MSFELDFEFLVTNKVKIENLEGLEESIRPFGLHVIADKEGYGRLNIDEYLPRYSLDDETVEFCFTTHVMPYIAKNEVLIAKAGSASFTFKFKDGFKDPSWLSAFAVAYVRTDDGIRSKSICLEDIYKNLAEALNIDPNTKIDKAEREI